MSAEPPGPALTAVAGGVQFEIKVVPGASRTKIAGVLGSALKLAIAAPPEGGKANSAVGQLLADVLGVKRSAVQIVRGTTQPHKRVAVLGVSVEHVRRQLAQSLGANP